MTWTFELQNLKFTGFVYCLKITWPDGVSARYPVSSNEDVAQVLKINGVDKIYA